MLEIEGCGLSLLTNRPDDWSARALNGESLAGVLYVHPNRPYTHKETASGTSKARTARCVRVQEAKIPVTDNATFPAQSKKMCVLGRQIRSWRGHIGPMLVMVGISTIASLVLTCMATATGQTVTRLFAREIIRQRRQLGEDAMRRPKAWGLWPKPHWSAHSPYRSKSLRSPHSNRCLSDELQGPYTPPQ